MKVVDRAGWVVSASLAAAILGAWGWADLPTNPDEVIRFGVISPTDSPFSSRLGENHEASVLLAYQRSGRAIRTSTRVYHLLPHVRSDHGDEDQAAKQARVLADESVVAIIGPVNSESTETVLRELHSETLPVLSALSTSTEIASDPNFFRLIFDDAKRMSDYAAFVRRENGGRVEKALILYQDDKYGASLREALRRNLGTTEIDEVPWHLVAKRSPCGSDGSACPEGEALGASKRVELVEHVLANLQDDGKLADSLSSKPSNFRHIFILGSAKPALALASVLEEKGRREIKPFVGSRYYFVGISPDLLGEAPPGSIVIGDPTLDPERASDPNLAADWADLLEDFERRSKLSAEDFTVTAYEAYTTFYEALRQVLEEHEGNECWWSSRVLGRCSVAPLDVPTMRTRLRAKLLTKQFSSLEPWRLIEFSRGQLLEAPAAPIYTLEVDAVRRDSGTDRPWLSFEPNGWPGGFLEGPVHLDVRAHGLNGEAARYHIASKATRKIWSSGALDFRAGLADLRSYFLPPGRYQVFVPGVATVPAAMELHVGWPAAYAIVAVTSLLGAMIGSLARTGSPSGWRDAVARMASGVLAGMVIAILWFFTKDETSLIHLPTISSDARVNAGALGFLGGLAGPRLILDIVNRWRNQSP